MSSTEEHVRLRRACPCGRGEVLMLYRLPTADGQEGYFAEPRIACPHCAARYRAQYHAHPDRAELEPLTPTEGDAREVVTYLVEPPAQHRVEAVDHA